MKHIRKEPRILEDEDRWGQPMGAFHVDCYSGYVEDAYWDELQEFETYKYSDDNLEAQIKLPGFKLENVHAPKMERLLKRSYGMVWQFNLRLTPFSSNNIETDYLRCFALFGEKTLREHRSSDFLLIARLHVICRWKNLRSTRRIYERA